MSLEDYRNNIDQLKPLGLLTVVLTGGEPLLNPDLVEIARYSKGKNIKVILSTNGLLLGEKYKECIDYVDEIVVSIDGLENINDEIRGIKGYYNKSINALIKIRNEYPNKILKIATTITNKNIDDIGGLLELCRKHKIYWGLNLLDNSPYFFKDFKIRDLQDIKDINKINDFKKTLHYYKKKGIFRWSSASINTTIESLGNRKDENIPCFIGFIWVHVDSKSNLYSGCWALPPMGNLKKKNIDECIHSKEYKERIINMYQKKCPVCTCGFDTNCDIYHLNRLVLEKVSEKCSIFVRAKREGAGTEVSR